MSDRRPEKLYVRHHHEATASSYAYRSYDEASPADLLAVVCRGVESGTIKGEVVQWCEDHGASVVPELGGCGKYEPQDCWVVSRVLLGPVSDGGSET